MKPFEIRKQQVALQTRTLIVIFKRALLLSDTFRNKMFIFFDVELTFKTINKEEN